MGPGPARRPAGKTTIALALLNYNNGNVVKYATPRRTGEVDTSSCMYAFVKRLITPSLNQRLEIGQYTTEFKTYIMRYPREVLLQSY